MVQNQGRWRHNTSNKDRRVVLIEERGKPDLPSDSTGLCTSVALLLKCRMRSEPGPRDIRPHSHLLEFYEIVREAVIRQLAPHYKSLHRGRE